jgi:ligand-binding SRPBCC domain-containing protein
VPELIFEAIIAAPLEEVWAFYDDPVQGLPALSPPEAQVQLESVDVPVRVGSRIILTARGPFKRIRWIAVITQHRPPYGVVFGREARFVDEQQKGPFAFFRHEHEFEYVDEKTTRLIDRVTYRVGFGPIGWLADALFVRRKLKEMFRYRHEQTKRVLDKR